VSVEGSIATPRRRTPVLASPPWRVRFEGLSSTRLLVIVGVVGAILAGVVYWPVWPGDPHVMLGCGCGDSLQEAWFLQWVPWAVTHGHNPLLTNWMDYPSGANLMANTSMPALAIAMAPVTWLWGGVTSYNLLLWMAWPLSAVAGAFVIRRVVASNLAALVGGLLYGFSPYVAGQGSSHVFLIFVPLPPLIFYALYRLVVTRDASPRRLGLTLGLLVVAQFFIAEEVMADTAIVATVGLAYLALRHRRRLSTVLVGDVARTAGWALTPIAVLLAYPLYLQFVGPQAIRGAAHGANGPYKLDLLGTIVPNAVQWFRPAFTVAMGNGFIGGDIGEVGGYLGVPLVLIVILIVWRQRHVGLVRFLAGMLIVCEVLSLGSRLVVANHVTSIPLPWALVANLPLLRSDLPNRFALMSSWCVALLVASGLASWSATDSRTRRTSRRPAPRWRRMALGLLGVGALVAYVPRVPFPHGALPDTPAFFTSALDNQIPDGSVVLPFPIATVPYATPMYWQMRTNFRWRMIGGEAIVLGKLGPTGQLARTRPLTVTHFFAHWSGSSLSAAPLDAHLVTQMREFVRLNNVGTVVVDPTAGGATPVVTLVSEALGAPRREGGVDVWFSALALARARSVAG